MNHNQTIADLEREQAPNTWDILAGLIVIAAGLYLACVFAFSL